MRLNLTLNFLCGIALTKKNAQTNQPERSLLKQNLLFNINNFSAMAAIIDMLFCIEQPIKIRKSGTIGAS